MFSLLPASSGVMNINCLLMSPYTCAAASPITFSGIITDSFCISAIASTGMSALSVEPSKFRTAANILLIFSFVSGGRTTDRIPMIARPANTTGKNGIAANAAPIAAAIGVTMGAASAMIQPVVAVSNEAAAVKPVPMAAVTVPHNVAAAVEAVAIAPPMDVIIVVPIFTNGAVTKLAT